MTFVYRPHEHGYICGSCGEWWPEHPEGLDFWRCSECDGPVGPVWQYVR